MSEQPSGGGAALNGEPPQPSRGFFARSRNRASRRVWVQHVEVNAEILEARLVALRARRKVLRERELRRRGASRARRSETLRALAFEEAIDVRVQVLLRRARAAARREYPVPNRIPIGGAGVS